MKIKKYLFLIIFSFFIIPTIHAASASVSYQSHIQNIGWQDWVSNGDLAGTEGLSLRLESLKINLENTEYSGGIQYKAHVQNIGWMDWVSNGDLAGTEGLSLRLEAIRIKLTGNMEKNYNIYYRVHIENIGWTDWTSNGEVAGSEGYSYRLEAVQIKLVKKSEKFSEKTGNAYYIKEASITYQSHIENIGWQGLVGNNGISGTEGENLRLEALKINFDRGAYSGILEYQAHVQNIGWMDWTSSGGISGTEGLSLRIEAIRIKLSGDITNYYDIYYRTHIENFGWTGWNTNGEAVGSTGYGYRMEAIQIKLVKKGEEAPSVSSETLYVKPDFYWYRNSKGEKVLENSISGIVGTNVKKIIDISVWNGDIDFNKVKNSDVDGIILRVGYGSYSEDSRFQEYLSEVKRLNIPYGIYLFSYAENGEEAISEAEFVLSEIKKHNLNPTLGIYYDIESWNIGSYYPNITPAAYDDIITSFVNKLKENNYDSSVYTGVNFANTKFSGLGRSHISWIAQYNYVCQYSGSYKIWQYTSSDKIPGISGNVDSNVMFN